MASNLKVSNWKSTFCWQKATCFQKLQSASTMAARVTKKRRPPILPAQSKCPSYSLQFRQCRSFHNRNICRQHMGILMVAVTTQDTMVLQYLCLHSLSGTADRSTAQLTIQWDKEQSILEVSTDIISSRCIRNLNTKTRLIMIWASSSPIRWHFSRTMKEKEVPWWNLKYIRISSTYMIPEPLPRLMMNFICIKVSSSSVRIRNNSPRTQLQVTLRFHTEWATWEVKRA